MKQNPARHITTLCVTALLALCASSQLGYASGENCQVTFQLIAENGIGTIAPGEVLQGSISFTVLSAWRQDEETVSYTTNGTMMLSREGHGSVFGHVAIVHVVRSPYTADYIAVDATQVVGDLGGQQTYVDPMLVRLYGPRNTLTSFDLPTNDAEWNILSERRIFQVYTPTTADTFNGPISNLTGTCS